MNRQYEQVKQFHTQFQSPYADEPKLLSADRVEKRYQWMLEEINEFKAAQTIDEQADAVIDLIYFALGAMVEMGVKPESLFEIVHQANMSKIWEDGKPHFENGKVIKPPTWIDPKPLLIEAINQQIKK
ncbi:MAG TPA: HAD family hydrolase [Bacillota bacterium]|nr:HAD family hydrolase [Bacillota bacterium]